jgi:predicted nucleic acid-binding protein
MQTKRSVVGDEEKLLEVRLWQAVIVTTIQEWVSGPLRRKREAEEYLFKDQRDFLLVCQSAGLDAGRLRSKLARLRPRQKLRVSNAPKVLGRVLLQH